MRALTLGKDDDGLVLEDLPEPPPSEGEVLVEALALGICGTDRKLLGRPATPAPGHKRLVIGHETLGEVLEAPRASGLRPGDMVVGLVRYPGPKACSFCKAGEADICEDEDFTERGIFGRDGFGAERYRLDLSSAVRVDPKLGLSGVLVEPTSIVCKGWEKLDGLVGRRRRALVLGAGPIGLLAALVATQRGYQVDVMDIWAEGPKPRQARSLGANYHTTTATLSGGFDAVMECTGALISEAVRQTGPGGAACLIGEGDDRSVPLLATSDLGKDLVRRNKAVVGIASSNRRHFEAAHRALLRADPNWLSGLLSPCAYLEDWRSAFDDGPGHIKAVIRFKATGASTDAGSN